MAENALTGTTISNPYGGENTKDYSQSLTDRYAQMVSDQNGSIDSAVSAEEKSYQRIQDAGNEMLDKQTAAEKRTYNELQDRLSSIERNNGSRQGIGRTQYGANEASLDQGLGGIAQQRSQLEKDTAREVADLRSRGEYEKASAALQTAQQKFQQLYTAALNQDANLRGNYEYITGLQREDANIQRDQEQTDREWQRKLGQMLLSKGVMPEESTLAAMNIDQNTAQTYINAVNLAAVSGGSGGGGSSKKASESPEEEYVGTEDTGGTIPTYIQAYSNPRAKNVYDIANAGNYDLAQEQLDEYYRQGWFSPQNYASITKTIDSKAAVNANKKKGTGVKDESYWKKYYG